MNRKFVLTVCSLVLLSTAAEAQMTVRPQVLTVPKVNAPPPEAAPAWYKDFIALQKRVAVLEDALNKAQQETAALRQEYAGHTHAAYKTVLVWKNEDCESYDHAGKDDPDSWMCPQITKFTPDSRVTTGLPLQEPPGKPLP